MKKYSAIYMEEEYMLERKVFEAENDFDAIDKAFELAYEYDNDGILEEYLDDLNEYRGGFEENDNPTGYALYANDLLADPPCKNFSVNDLLLVVDLEEHRALIGDGDEFFLN